MSPGSQGRQSPAQHTPERHPPCVCTCVHVCAYIHACVCILLQQKHISTQIHACAGHNKQHTHTHTPTLSHRHTHIHTCSKASHQHKCSTHTNTHNPPQTHHSPAPSSMSAKLSLTRYRVVKDHLGSRRSLCRRRTCVCVCVCVDMWGQQQLLAGWLVTAGKDRQNTTLHPPADSHGQQNTNRNMAVLFAPALTPTLAAAAT